jgi:hypothetical protein
MTGPSPCEKCKHAVHTGYRCVCGCPSPGIEVSGVINEKSADLPRKHSHYFKSVEGLKTIDVYRVLELFAVTDPCIQHAVKKLLVAGGRGSKDISKDIREAIVTLERWEEMREENGS